MEFNVRFKIQQECSLAIEASSPEEAIKKASTGLILGEFFEDYDIDDQVNYDFKVVVDTGEEDSSLTI